MVLLLRVMVKLLWSLIISFDNCLQVSACTETFCNSVCQLPDISCTESEVFASLESLNPNKASRPDNLHSQVLKIVLKVWLNLFSIVYTVYKHKYAP